MLEDDGVKLDSVHPALATSALEVEQQRGQRSEGRGTVVRERALEIAQWIVLDGRLVRFEGLEVAELAVARSAAKVGLLELGRSRYFLDFDARLGYDLFVAIAVHVVIESKLRGEVTGAVETLEAVVVAIKTHVTRESGNP